MKPWLFFLNNTSEEQDTSQEHRQLYGMSAFSQVKIQMKVFRGPSGLHLFLILICHMDCHLSVTRPT